MRHNCANDRHPQQAVPPEREVWKIWTTVTPSITVNSYTVALTGMCKGEKMRSFIPLMLIDLRQVPAILAGYVDDEADDMHGSPYNSGSRRPELPASRSARTDRSERPPMGKKWAYQPVRPSSSRRQGRP